MEIKTDLQNILCEKKEDTSPSQFLIESLPLKRAVIDYIEIFLSKEEATNLFDFCLKKLPFDDHKVRIYGKYLLQPRKTCAFGVKSYSYSGLTLQTQPMPPEFNYVIDRLMLVLPEGHPRPDTVLCNLYENGDRYISQHSDSLKDLEENACICGLSLGATRHFDLKGKDKEEDEKYRLDLTHGSLIIMGKGTQTFYTHGVPIQKTIKDPRINLTFRVSKK